MTEKYFQKFEKKHPEMVGVKSYEYAKDAILGRGIFSKFIIKAAKRFIKDLQREDLIFDLDEVERVNVFFGEIIYVPELKKSVPLQPPRAFHLEQLFGFFYKDTGLRRFTSSYYQVGRKNLKTFDAAGIALFEGLTGRDLSPEIMVAANSRDQAIICTDKIGKIIKASPELRDKYNQDLISLHTYKKLVNTITYEDDYRICRIEAMPKDPGDGGNPSGSITDELHEAKTLNHLETAESGQAQRKEPLNEVITSPGHNKTGPCYTVLRQKSIDVLDEKIGADRHLALMYEMDSEEELNKIIESMDDKQPGSRQLDKIEALEKSNPLKPYIETIAPYLADRMIKAKTEGGQTAANIKIKNGGVWIDAPLIWIPSETIKANNHGITEKDLLGKKCCAGLDLSAGLDLNAFVMQFEEINGIIPVKALFWIPQDKIDNQKTDAVDYRRFAEQGWMHVFQGNVNEYNVIAEHIEWELEKYNCLSMGCDPKYLYSGPVPVWSERGKQELIDKIMPVGQGFNLTSATGQIEQWAAKKKMDFMGNPVMEMCFSNTTLHLKDSGNVQDGGISGHKFPSKGKSTGRIDGVLALVMAEFENQRLKAEPKPVENKIHIW